MLEWAALNMMALEGRHIRVLVAQHTMVLGGQLTGVLEVRPTMALVVLVTLE
jgi:hypothetical protein